MRDGRFIRRSSTFRRGRGFTLVELAVVVLVVGLLIGSLLVPLSTQVDQRNIAEAQRRLEDARDALLGFAVANGRFPCPASTSTSTTGTEEFATSPTIGTPTNGICKSFTGFLPGQTLGLNNLDASGYALDGYPMTNGQGRILYAIADTTLAGVAHGLTVTGQMRTTGISVLGNAATLYLYVCSISTNMPVAQTNCGVGGSLGATTALAPGNAVFVVYSLGKNGTSGTSVDELKNINPPAGAKAFLGKSYSSVQGADFDDQLLWVSNYTLISRMVAAGVLP